jgi:twinkle protein
MIIKYADVREQVKEIRKNGLPQGFSTGWGKVDSHFRPMQGYFCVLTGIPSHGKSEVFDALMCNMAWQHGWRWAIFSPENYPVALHYNKIAEKFIGLSQSRATDSDYSMAMSFIDEHMTWIYPPAEDDYTLEQVLAEVKQVKDTYGLDGFVIDPWNEIDHARPKGMSETEYIDRSLRKFRRFCREEKLFGTIIAHPTKMYPLKDGTMPPVNLWSISGSAAWRNKADFGLVVSRPDMSKNEPILDVQKIKQKNFGKIGQVELFYDYHSGRIKDTLTDKFNLPERGV